VVPIKVRFGAWALKSISLSQRKGGFGGGCRSAGRPIDASNPRLPLRVRLFLDAMVEQLAAIEALAP
jgi:hypothetical protein